MDIVTSRNKTIKNLPIKSEYFVNQTTILYGPSKSGKSVLIVDILHSMRDEVPLVFCVCPTEPQNQTYKGIIPGPAIRIRTDPDALIPFLKEFWSRQEIATAMYKKASDINTLMSLYRRVRNQGTDMKLQKIEGFLQKTLIEIERKIRESNKNKEFYFKERDKVKEEVRKIKVSFFKSILEPFRKQLLKHNGLSDDEKYTMKYLKINPKAIIIFDDCASQIKKVQSTALFKNYVYMNRHVNVTTIIAAQDDTNIDTDIRKNAFQSIFCTAQVAHGYFNRPSNDFSKDERREIESINHAIYHGEGFKRLVYSRGSDEPFKYVEATKHYEKFKCGSTAFWVFCSKTEDDSATVSKDNSFYDLFAQ